MSGGNTTPRGTGAECRKFAPNIFNKSKCSSCFKQKEEHSAEALECNRATRKISKCGYLFVAPGWDFSNPLNRTKDDDTSMLELHSLLYVDWYDSRLKWDAKKFDNITEMPVDPSKIWTPEMTHRGGGIGDYWADLYIHERCFVRSQKGYVSCMVSTVFNIRCDTDYTLWPYDRQSCTLLLAAWAHTDQELYIKKQYWQSVTGDMYEPDPGWNLYAVNVTHQSKKSFHDENSNTSTVMIDFVLDRTPGGYRGRVISPAILIMVMTLITMYLEPRSLERLSIGCLNIVIHLLALLGLSWYLPHNGDTVPIILLFYCDSLVLATMAFLLTFVLGRIETSQSCPPKWITAFIVRILKNKFGQAFMLSIFEIGDPRPAAEVEAAADDTSALVDSDSNSRKLIWRYVSTLFLRVSYYLSILIYFIMLIVLIPSSSKPPLESILI